MQVHYNICYEPVFHITQLGLTRSITQINMSVIYFCFLYILDICLLTVNVFAPQFNVYYNCELSPIPNGWNCRLIHAIFIRLLIFRIHLIQLLVYLSCFITLFSLPRWSSSLLYFSNLLLCDDTA